MKGVDPDDSRRNIAPGYILLPLDAAAPSRFRTSKMKKIGMIAGRTKSPEEPATCMEALQQRGPMTMPAV